MVKIINNINLGNYLIAILEWFILLIEIIVIFYIYLHTFKKNPQTVIKKNSFSNLFVPSNNRINENEKLFCRLLFLLPSKNAFLVKDIFYALRNHRIQLWFLLGFISVWLVSQLQIDFFYKYIIMISIPTMILAPLSCNLFAYEDRGLFIYFLSPLSAKDIIFQKNFSIIVIESLLTIPIIIWTLINISIDEITIIITIPILIYQFCNTKIWGTIISLYFPYNVNYMSIIGQFNPIVSQLYIMLSFAFAEGLLAFCIIMFNNNKLVLLIILFLLAVILMKTYKYLIENTYNQLFLKRRESLIKDIVKSEMKIYE
ncbi:hypothetical protein ABRY23_04600 [Melioribacteraceae bacterium 4301-Me]|uniref:hypothetical protein n=1 Tax=Pyranulibacter aquaticus TaxID=3163344 RepID=UPI00359B7C1C